MGRWAQHHIATLLGVEPTTWSKILNGQVYPARLQLMQKIQVVFGWDVSEQVQLIPMYWDWPDQARGGVGPGEPVDLRYAIKLARVVAEWSDANPRTVKTQELKLHPDLKPINRDQGPRFVKKAAAGDSAPAVEEEKPASFAPPKGPVLRR